ncbi:hypothetical protein AMATHDRAFT_158750 [Amanita thiersii Skay4041]|uniref:Uncharacterized protein n=1 Tax=Amanita thiersii Skay4041 TaxID=703135 RepID=A0A2A9N6V4_9AGAR|nr:hypothetical protein AMATHDRAFT_158750 [Amanita thiersii Skay4041]
MDLPLDPPTRIQPVSATPVSVKRAIKHLDVFLNEFEARSRNSNHSGNSAVMVQLQKLREALTKEKESKKIK